MTPNVNPSSSTNVTDADGRVLREELAAIGITLRDDIPKVDDRPTRDPSPPRLPTRWVELPPGSPGINILDLLDGDQQDASTKHANQGERG